jgi:hypothetical protein
MRYEKERGMSELLPGTEVEARGLRWEVVFAERLGPQVLYRLRGLERGVVGEEMDLLHPFEPLRRIVHDFQPNKAAPLRNWLVYHQAFLLEQALGTHALLARAARPVAARSLSARTGVTGHPYASPAPSPG